jgi:hypothetical protein
MRFLALTLALVAAGCGQSSSTPGTPQPQATPGPLAVSGRITDRIDGSTISGSKVTFKGLSVTGHPKPASSEHLKTGHFG